MALTSSDLVMAEVNFKLEFVLSSKISEKSYELYILILSAHSLKCYYNDYITINGFIIFFGISLNTSLFNSKINTISDSPKN